MRGNFANRRAVFWNRRESVNIWLQCSFVNCFSLRKAVKIWGPLPPLPLQPSLGYWEWALSSSFHGGGILRLFFQDIYRQFPPPTQHTQPLLHLKNRTSLTATGKDFPRLLMWSVKGYLAKHQQTACRQSARHYFSKQGNTTSRLPKLSKFAEIKPSDH